MVGNNEQSLAKAAFAEAKETENVCVMDLGGLVSRRRTSFPLSHELSKMAGAKRHRVQSGKAGAISSIFPKEMDSATVSSPHKKQWE